MASCKLLVYLHKSLQCHSRTLELFYYFFFHFLRYGQVFKTISSPAIKRHSAICQGQVGKHNCIPKSATVDLGDPITPVESRKAGVRHSHRKTQQSNWNSEQPTWKVIKSPYSPARSIRPQQKMPIYIVIVHSCIIEYFNNWK